MVRLPQDSARRRQRQGLRVPHRRPRRRHCPEESESAGAFGTVEGPAGTPRRRIGILRRSPVRGSRNSTEVPVSSPSGARPRAVTDGRRTLASTPGRGPRPGARPRATQGSGGGLRRGPRGSRGEHGRGLLLLLPLAPLREDQPARRAFDGRGVVVRGPAAGTLHLSVRCSRSRRRRGRCRPGPRCPRGRGSRSGSRAAARSARPS